MKYTPSKLPDEFKIAILYSQAWNLAVEMESNGKSMGTKGTSYSLTEWQQYFFDQLMLPYKPLLEARAETEKALNLKARKKEIKETKGEINYEENNEQL